MLLWIDGFDNFGTVEDAAPSPTGIVARKYPVYNEGSTKIAVCVGRLGGYGIYINWDTTVYFSPGNLTTNATMIVGFAFKISGAINNNSQFLGLYDGANRGVNFRIRTDGEINVYRYDTLLGTTSGANIGVGAWRYIEVKVVSHDTTGSVVVKVDRDTKLSLTNIDTKVSTNEYHTTFRFTGVAGGSGSSRAVRIDDLYCLDGSGSANNNFLGNVRVDTIRPDAAGDSTQLTPSAGSNYECVDEEVCDDDSTYVESATDTHKDLYGTDAAVSGDIFGVQVNTDCRETDATSFDIKTVCKSSTTESDDAGQAIGSTDYLTRTRILEQDPHTSAAWLAAGVNSAQFGLKVVA